MLYLARYARNRLQAVALAAAAMALAACGQDGAGPETGPAATPALWRVTDADTTVYLFGSIHMLPPGTNWRSGAVDRALAEVPVVYFEADVLGDPVGMMSLVERIGRLPKSQTLSTQLSPEQSLVLGAVAARLGLSRAALDTMQPWYASVVISDAAIRAAGYGPEAGVDTQLRQDATRAGKQLRFLETVEQQLSALATLPADVQLAYLGLTLDEADNVKPLLARVVAAWRSGDVDTLTRVLIAEDMARLPALEEALLRRRNSGWASLIAELIENEPGAFFIAVGAAHLIGDGSVQTELVAHGHVAERLQ
jgi:uncharacterized protein YbaP (TraB family)